jgi:3-phenylpropionate/trans-cinnamate dioxygenase ferredoxin subunit
MTHWVETIRLEDIPLGHGRTVDVAGRSIALFNIDGVIHAIDDTCPHMGSSLGAGVISGRMVTCRGHGMKFDVTSGFEGGKPGYGVATHAVKEVDGVVFVAVADS